MRNNSKIRISYAQVSVNLPEVYLNTDTTNRLSLTITYASGDPMTLLIDESEFSSTTPMSSFLQVPPTDDLPSYLEHVKGAKVELFIYNCWG